MVTPCGGAVSRRSVLVLVGLAAFGLVLLTRRGGGVARSRPPRCGRASCDPAGRAGGRSLPRSATCSASPSRLPRRRVRPIVRLHLPSRARRPCRRGPSRRARAAAGTAARRLRGGRRRRAGRSRRVRGGSRGPGGGRGRVRIPSPGRHRGATGPALTPGLRTALTGPRACVLSSAAFRGETRTAWPFGRSSAGWFSSRRRIRVRSGTSPGPPGSARGPRPSRHGAALLARHLRARRSLEAARGRSPARGADPQPRDRARSRRRPGGPVLLPVDRARGGPYGELGPRRCREDGFPSQPITR